MESIMCRGREVGHCLCMRETFICSALSVLTPQLGLACRRQSQLQLVVDRSEVSSLLAGLIGSVKCNGDNSIASGTLQGSDKLPPN